MRYDDFRKKIQLKTLFFRGILVSFHFTDFGTKTVTKSGTRIVEIENRIVSCVLFVLEQLRYGKISPGDELAKYNKFVCFRVFSSISQGKYFVRKF